MSPTPAPTKVSQGFRLLKVNDQGKKVSTTDTFTPFTTNAIRLSKVPGAQLNGHWFRATEITVFGVDGKKIKPLGASTDNWHGAWRSSSWARELFDDNHAWGNDKGVHFQNSAVLWFDKPVTIAKMTFNQVPNANHVAWALNDQWRWEEFIGHYNAVAVPTPYPTPPTPFPTAFPTPTPTATPTFGANGGFTMPCMSAEGWATTCPADPTAAAKLKPVLSLKGKCTMWGDHSDRFKRLFIGCPLHQTVLGKAGAGGTLVFKNAEGGSIKVSSVVRWSWAGNALLFLPEKTPGLTADGKVDRTKAEYYVNMVNDVMYGHGVISVEKYNSPTSAPTPAPTYPTEDGRQAQIKSCKASENQHNYHCNTAFDGNTVADRNHGWAINGKAPADGVFIFDKSYAINHVDLYSKYVDGEHEINDFSVFYSTVVSPAMPIDADEWMPMTSVSFAEPAKDGKIVGNKVTVAGQDLLRLGFATVQATAIRLHVRGSNAQSDNIVLTEIIAFNMATAPPTGAPTAFPTAEPTKVPTFAPTNYKHCGANCGMAGFHPWPTDDHAASLPWNTLTRTNMYCAGTCNRCGTGCSCGTSDSGVLRHMYVKNAAGQQKLSGYRSCPPGTHQPENKCVNGVAACVPIG